MQHLPAKFTLHAYKKNSVTPTGVAEFSAGKNYIILKFLQPTTDGKQIYLYNSEMPGKEHVEEMKKRAAEGKHLSTYLNQSVRENYYAFWNESARHWELNNA